MPTKNTIKRPSDLRAAPVSDLTIRGRVKRVHLNRKTVDCCALNTYMHTVIVQLKAFLASPFEIGNFVANKPDTRARCLNNAKANNHYVCVRSFAMCSGQSAIAACASAHNELCGRIHSSAGD